MDAPTQIQLVQKTFDLDGHVRFVGVIGDEGELVAGGMLEGLSALEPTKKEENKLYLKWFLIQAMTDEWDKFLGKKKLVYTRHEKIDMYGIPLDNSKILLVSVARDLETPFLGDKLLNLLRQK
jgi:hypothetical protein